MGRAEMGVLVLVENAEGVAELTLNRPEKLNAFTIELHRELAAAIDGAAADPTVRALLLTGAGRGFCAGQDLQARAAMLAGGEAFDGGGTIEAWYNPLVR